MSEQRVLITGGLGCIGSQAAKWLLAETEVSVCIASRSVSAERYKRVFSTEDHEQAIRDGRLRFVELDVRDVAQIDRVLADEAITHVVHMAALQTPDCNKHRDLGLQINLGGTQNLIESMKRSCSIERFVFASSVAVYGPRAVYPPGQVPMLAQPQPVNVYGTWKLAGEQLAGFFQADTGIPTLSLRPGVLFGPGRDAGLTSSPTTAMKHVVQGKTYTIPFRTQQDYQYAPDVGAAVGIATTQPFDGYAVYTLPGQTTDSQGFTRHIEAAAKQLGLAAQCQISVGDDEVPFICELDFAPFLDRFPSAPLTPMSQAVEQSLSEFQRQHQLGWLE
ncbi:MAG: NAD-dependent epimerase/dehydratase [Aureliella sp.]